MKIRKSVKETNESLTVTVLEEESGLFINADFQKNNVYVQDGDDEEIEEKIYILRGGSGGGSAQITDHKVIKEVAKIVQSYECKQLMDRLPTTKINKLDFKPIFEQMIQVIKNSQLIFKGGDDS